MQGGIATNTVSIQLNGKLARTIGGIIRAYYRILENKPLKPSLGKLCAFKSNVYGGSKVNNDFWIKHNFS